MYTGFMIFYLHALILVPHPTELDGAGFSAVFDTTPVNITAIQGRTVFLNCSGNYLDDYKVAWLNPENKVLTNNERRIIDDIRITIEHPTKTDWNLHFRDIQHFDEGVYSCSVNTRPVQTKKVYLRILVPPRIIDYGTSHDINAIEGTTVQLICNATGIPMPSVQWFRHIPRDSYDKATKEAVVEPGEVLLIHNISRYCGGTYECIAYNGVEKADAHQIDVEVVFQPEIELPTKRISQLLHKETILQCIIRANPLLASEWQRNGIRLENDRKYRTEIYDHYIEIYTKVLDLHIKSIQKDDYGNYTCVAYNNLGEDKETMLLSEMVPTTKAPTTEQTSSTSLRPPSYQVYKEREKVPEIQENRNSRPTPEKYRPRNSGVNLLVDTGYTTLLFFLWKCLTL